ncbi:MAG: synthase subunit epsilon [Bacilli bacterium]|nr:synthase subunit epsilon [Bacilli bacterium]
MRTVPLEIVTPDRQVYSGEVNMIIARGGDGELGILPGHTPIVTTLKVAPLRMQLNDGTREVQVAVSGGFLEVQPEKITVLATAAELPEEIDFDRAERAKQRAEGRISGAANSAEINVERAVLALQRATTRLQVGRTR